MQEPVKEENAVWSFIQVIVKSMTIAQQPDETMTDYIKRFKQNRDFFKGVIKSDFMTGWLGDQPEYIALNGTLNQDADQTAMKNATVLPVVCHTSSCTLLTLRSMDHLRQALKLSSILGTISGPRTPMPRPSYSLITYGTMPMRWPRKKSAQSRAASLLCPGCSRCQWSHMQLLWCQGTHQSQMSQAAHFTTRQVAQAQGEEGPCSSRSR